VQTTSHSFSEPGSGFSPPRSPGVLSWAAWGVLAFHALARVVVSLDPFPHWEMDPTVSWSPATALGPTAVVVLDCLALFAAGLALFSEWLAGRRVLVMPAALLALGAVTVAYHSFHAGLIDVDNARIGLGWLGAGATAIACTHLCRHESVRRVTLAAAVGVVAMLVVKGAQQVFIEHPETVRNFQENREAILGAHGWSPDSPMARGFERRLEQAEATGWFGLANVYASVAAASFVALFGLAVVAWRSARSAAQDVPDGIAAVVTLGLLAAGAGVVMAGSKAGFAVSGLGIVLLVIAWLGSRERAGWLRIRRPIPGGPLAVLIVASVLLAVALRGAIGEAMREPSILFRWFYVEGAARVILEHPVWGVGPGGFKDAYMLAKPAAAPESVDSPHSILFDYGAKLGLGGAALGVLFLWLVWRCGVSLVNSNGGAPDAPVRLRLEAWAGIGIASAATLLSAWIESRSTSIDSAAGRVIGLVAWAGLALAMLWVMRAARAWPVCFAAAAIVVAAHAQIEMTPIQPASAAWFMLMLGAAAAPHSDDVATEAPSRMLGLIAPAALGLSALAAAAIVFPPVFAWERNLGHAAELVRPIAEIRARLRALPQTGPAGLDSIRQIATDLGGLTSLPPPTNDAELGGALTRLTATRIQAAVPVLRDAAERLSHEGTREALSRLHLGLASALAEAGDADGASQEGEAAERIALDAANRYSGHAPAFGWLGTVRATRAALERDRGHLARAVEAWEEAAALDPHGMTFPHQIFRALVTLGRVEEARPWARRVLEANDRLRLDPLMQLTDKEREAVDRVLNTGPP
jgi:tetratricopeptide (TPR) repeat protein